MARTRLWLVALSFLAVLPSANGITAEPGPIAPRWAASIELAEPGNVYRVSDTLYRGARVSREGAIQLQRLGIKTVVSLRVVDADSRYITRAGLDCVHIPIQGLEARRATGRPVPTDRHRSMPAARLRLLLSRRRSNRPDVGRLPRRRRRLEQGRRDPRDDRRPVRLPPPVGINLPQFIRHMDVERIRERMRDE